MHESLWLWSPVMESLSDLPVGSRHISPLPGPGRAPEPAEGEEEEGPKSLLCFMILGSLHPLHPLPPCRIHRPHRQDHLTLLLQRKCPQHKAVLYHPQSSRGRKRTKNKVLI